MGKAFESKASLVLTAALIALGVLGTAGCKKGRPADQGGPPGKNAVTQGIAADLRATPDRRFLTYLTDAAKPRLEGVPPQMLVGVLEAMPAGGGGPRRLGAGVTNVPGGYLHSPDSRWVLFLDSFNASSHTGVLHVADLSDAAAAPARVDADVSYLLPSPDSKHLAYVKSGVLHLGPLPGGPFREVAGEVTTGAFSPDGASFVFKRTQSAAGGIALVPVASGSGAPPAPRKIADQVGDYAFSPDSKRLAWAVRSTSSPGTTDLFVGPVQGGKAEKVASSSSSFAFSPDSKWLARTEGSKLVEAVNFVGDLFVGPAEGGPGKKVGTSVREFAFSPDSEHLAQLESFDFSPGRSWGTLSVVKVPDGKAQAVGQRVKTYGWSSDGKSLAFQPIQFSQEFGPSADLMLFKVGADAAKLVMTGVWGYGFDPKARYLLARNNCTRVGAGSAPRSCDLFLTELGAAEPKPAKIIDAMYSFKTSPDGDTLLVTYAEIGPDTFNVASYDVKSKVRKTLDQHILLPAIFVGAESKAVAYVVAERSRAGVYVAPVDGPKAEEARK